jgi:uncharacterized membrane protein YfcA
VTLLFLFVVGAVAGVLNTLAGGASALLVPALVFAGLDVHAANGTNRVAILAQTGAGLASVRRGGGVWLPTLREGAASVLGGGVGALIATQLSARQLEGAIGAAILLCVPLVLRAIAVERPPAPAWMRDAALFVVGVYGGLVQVGVTFWQLAVLTALGGRDLRAANGVKLTLNLALTVPAFLTYLGDGQVRWAEGLATAAGAALGGWWGGRWALAWPASAVKAVVAGMMTVAAVGLLVR